MERDEMKKMLGMGGESSGPFYKLNKVAMNGDDGTFILTDLLAEREKGAKPAKKDLGKEISGVILKMRWALSKYNEPPAQSYNSTEYDDKWKDPVTVYPSRD